MRSVLIKHSCQVTSLTQSLSCALGLLQRAAGVCVCLTEGGVTQSRSEGQDGACISAAFTQNLEACREAWACFCHLECNCCEAVRK